MKERFAVSCTFHLIDETDLDSTSLQICEAKSKNDAALQIIIKEMLEYDGEVYDYMKRNPEYLDDEELDYDKESFNLPKEEFLQLRTTYWSEKIDLAPDEDHDYDYVFDDQNGRSGGVFGINVILV